MEKRVTSLTWGPTPLCKQSLSQSTYTFYRAPPGSVMLHLHASPRSPPQPILIHLQLSQLEERLNSEREAPGSNPDRSEQQPSVWVIPSLGSDVLLSHVNSKATQNNSLVRKE